MSSKTSEDMRRGKSGSEYGGTHRSPLTYNSYLKVHDLKNLQVCRSEHHDEPLFIIIHQTYELWFKLIIHELDEVASLMKQNKPRRANFYMKRVVQIMKTLVNQIHILETMTTKDFLGFRNLLNPASGFQSSQFREIEFMAGLRDLRMLDHFQEDEPAYKVLVRRFEEPSLGELFYQMLEANGFKLPRDEHTKSGGESKTSRPVHGDTASSAKAAAQPDTKSGATSDTSSGGCPFGGSTSKVDTTDSAGDEDPNTIARIRELKKLYDETDKYAEFHDLAESLMDLDELILLWRNHHVVVVERIIGFKRGTGGSQGVGYLRSTLSKKCFPDFWKLRTYLEE